MIPWDELVKAALLGTERQPFSAPAVGGALGAALSRIPRDAPDRALLAAAATVAAVRRAGTVPPVHAAATVQPAGRDDLPPVSQRAAQHLQAMSSGNHADLLPEWLSAVAAAGRRVPDVALPRLLDAARSGQELREPLSAVLGKRGRWLAARNPDWSYAAGAADPWSGTEGAEEAWQTGQRAARLSLLTRLRHGDPARARALLESTWPQEPAEDRAKFLASFVAGLSPQDEPFLEAALDDRSRDVRRAAADLLARLPGSQLVRRMTDRATPLLAWKAGKKPAVQVKLPGPPDKAAERDGIDPRSGDPRVGQKQWWLRQVVSAVPPSTWSKQWRASPAEVLAAVRQSGYEAALVLAWAHAAARHRDAAWAEAILNTDAATVVENAGQQLAAGLQSAMPGARREAVILEYLGGKDVLDDHAGSQLLRAHDAPWSPRLARAVVDRVRSAIARPSRAAGAGGYWDTLGLLREAALRVPATMLAELSRAWPEGAKDWERWKPAVDEFLAKVQFRRDMLEEIRK